MYILAHSRIALLQIDGIDTRREHKLTAGTVKNIHPCIFFTCVFAGQTRYWLKPPPSVVEMTRWGFFSSGTDAAGSIRSDVSAMLKLAVKSVQGCTLLTRQRSRYAVYFQKKRTAWSTASNRPYFGCIRNGVWMLLPPFSVPFWSYYRRLL